MPRKKQVKDTVAAPEVESAAGAPEPSGAASPGASVSAVELEISPADEPEAGPVGDVVASQEDGAITDAGGIAISRALTFRLGEQLFGLPIEQIQEIQQIVELMPLPDASPALVGLIDVRGLVVPAVDLRVLVGMERKEYTLETPIVFCRVQGRVVCLIVDSVEDVVEIPAGSMQAASSLYALADRMLGVCRLPQGLVMVFDLERLIPDAALTAAAELGGERG